MGVTIYANGSKQSFDMGSGGFFNLRKNIALGLDQEFGEHYATLSRCSTKEDYQRFDEVANRILADERFQDKEDVLDFLFAPDTDGETGYKTCINIFDCLQHIDLKGKCFVYANLSNGKDYEEFQQFLMDCYSHRRKMRWH